MKNERFRTHSNSFELLQKASPLQFCPTKRMVIGKSQKASGSEFRTRAYPVSCKICMTTLIKMPVLNPYTVKALKIIKGEGGGV